MSAFKYSLIAISAAAATAAVTSLIAAHETSASPLQTAASLAVPSAERGAYLIKTSGCGDCHTPLKMGPKGPEPDLPRAYSGHPADLKMPPAPRLGEGPWIWAGAATNTAFAGPWGVSYAMNLTPDTETGLGLWTEQQFVATLRTGRHLGVSRPVLPPMPIGATSEMSDSDLRSLYAYLRTIKPVRNRVPDPAPAQ